MNAHRALLSCCGFAVLSFVMPVFADEGGGAPIGVAPPDLKWEASPRFPFQAIARVWGASETAQGRFVKYSEGKVLPLHKHTATVRVVVLSGTYVYARQGVPEKRFPPGSFVLTPAGTPHVAGCSEPCMYFEEIDGKPDFTPVATSK